MPDLMTDDLNGLSDLDLDAVVAEEVMGAYREPDPLHGWRWFYYGKEGGWTWTTRKFSTDPIASYQLKQEMRRQGWTLTIWLYVTGHTRVSVACPFGPCERHGNTSNNWHGVEAVAADELRAIAIASVRAVRAVRAQKEKT